MHKIAYASTCIKIGLNRSETRHDHDRHHDRIGQVVRLHEVARPGRALGPLAPRRGVRVSRGPHPATRTRHHLQISRRRRAGAGRRRLQICRRMAQRQRRRARIRKRNRRHQDQRRRHHQLRGRQDHPFQGHGAPAQGHEPAAPIDGRATGQEFVASPRVRPRARPRPDALSSRSFRYLHRLLPETSGTG